MKKNEKREYTLFSYLIPAHKFCISITYRYYSIRPMTNMQWSWWKYQLKVMKRAILLFILLLFLTTSFAQTKGKIKGSIIDSTTMEPVPNASITVVNQKDTMLQPVRLISADGTFQINGLVPGAYQLTATGEGLETIKRRFSITEPDQSIDLGQLKTTRVYKLLSPVVVKSTAPVHVSGDTISYNTDYYLTAPNSVVEDLLRKLPGVSIDNNGNIKAQGETIQKVYVDGKEFFSGDTKLATKNLTADMVDQVQVYNDRSEQSKFTGVDDGTRSKVINLKLKKDKKRSTFGRAFAGYGTNDRYQTGLVANHFNGTSQLSVLAGANNINRSMYDLTNEATSGYTGINSKVNGITKSTSGGLNYANSWGSRLQLNGSYFYGRETNVNQRQSIQKDFLSSAIVLRNKTSRYEDLNQIQRINLKLVYTIDSLTSIIYSPFLTLQTWRQQHKDSMESSIEQKNDIQPVGLALTANTSNAAITNIENNVLFRRRLGKVGRTISLNLNASSHSTNTNSVSDIRSNSFDSTMNTVPFRSLNYELNYINRIKNQSAVISYTEPLKLHNLFELRYSYLYNTSSADRNAWRYDSTARDYTEYLDSLANRFKSSNSYHNAGVQFRGNQKNYSYQVGIALQKSVLSIEDLDRKNHMDRQYVNLIPTAMFLYRITSNHSVQLNYQGQSHAPLLIQLQDITDLSNYPFIRKGNPNLRPEFIHNLTLNYNLNNLNRQQTLFIYINYYSVRHKIANSIQESGSEQISMPVNINGSYTINSTINFGMPMPLKGSNINFDTRVDYMRDASIINGLHNFGKNLSIGLRIDVNYSKGSKLDFDIAASVDYTHLNYTIQKELNQTLLSQDYSLITKYTSFKGLKFSTRIFYNIYKGTGESFNQSFIDANLSMAKTFFKNEKGELMLSLNNIFNEKRPIVRNIYQNSIEEVRNENLGRYGLLTFTYFFNRSNRK